MQANLNKNTLFSGLSHLDFGFLQSTPALTEVGGDENLCDCNGVSPSNVLTVIYEGLRPHTMTLCICQNAVTDDNYMIETMGRVPYVVRRHDQVMVSATAGTCDGAGSSDDIAVFCDRNMDVSVFIHESAHSFDQRKSDSTEWRNAVALDTCVPDDYANSNYADNFAQVLVVWIYLVGHDLHYDLGGKKYACMRHQLRMMSQYVPPSSLNL